jgi:hypothetical protein
MNILAEFKKLKDAVAALVADQSKATLASITDLSTKISGIESGALAELNAATTRIQGLETAKSDAEGKVSELTGKLSDANKLEMDCKDGLLKHLASLPGHADYKEGGSKVGATLAELITAEQNATNAAISATGIKLDNLPSGGIPAPAPGGKTLSRTEFEALDFKARSEFFRTGGKLKD